MLSLDTGKTDVFLRKCITTKYGEKIHVKNISVLWKYKNIVTNDNDLIKFITVPIILPRALRLKKGTGRLI